MYFVGKVCGGMLGKFSIGSVKNALRRAVKLAAFRVVYPAAYKLGCLKKQQRGLVLFCEVRHGYLTDSFKPIYNELGRRGARCEIFYIHNNSGGMSYLLRYLKLCLIMPRAETVLIDDTCNLFGAFRLRRGCRLIQTWHSCGAFKKWGYSIAGLDFGQEPDELDKFPAHSNYSLVTVSSRECIPHFNEAFGFDKSGKKCVKATGVARTDYFFDENNIAAAYKKFYEKYPNARGKKILIYAPTYRGDADDAQPPKQFDIGKLLAAVGDDAVLLIKQHGFVKARTRIPESCRERAFEVGADGIKIEELLIVGDAVITDYSSLIFEYSLFLKPMIFYAYDLDEFYDYRGFYYRYDNDFLPGEIVRTESDLCRAAARALGGDYDKAAVERFRDRFMSACDGRATERIVNYIMRNNKTDK